MTLTPEQAAAIAAIIGGDTTPATSAPVFGAIASPVLTASGKAAAAVTPATIAQNLYPGDRENAKRHVALSLAPGWTCTIDATVEVDGVETPSALHGFLTERESGIACPGVVHLKRGEKCPGTIR